MLNAEQLREVDEIAAHLYRVAGANPKEPPAIGALCKALVGSAPKAADMLLGGACGLIVDRWVVRVNRRLTPARSRFVCAHEIGEWWYRHRREHQRFTLDELEARCDAIGARLLCPRASFERSLAKVGHRVHALARAYQVPQGLALLRVGEVTGRPVAFLRQPRLERGTPTDWTRAHPVRCDEQWGLMGR